MDATPWTTVQKMIGAIIILTSLMKPSPSGFSDLPNSGKQLPTAMPSPTAISTCTYRTPYQAVWEGGVEAVDVLKRGLVGSGGAMPRCYAVSSRHATERPPAAGLLRVEQS